MHVGGKSERLVWAIDKLDYLILTWSVFSLQEQVC